MKSETVSLVAPDSPWFQSYLRGKDYEPGPGETVVAAIGYERRTDLQAVLVIYFHASLGILVSFFSDLPRPWIQLSRCAAGLERWLRIIGIARYAFVIKASDRHYRAILERLGAKVVGIRDDDVLYVKDVQAIPRGRLAGVRGRHAGNHDKALAHNGSATHCAPDPGAS